MATAAETKTTTADSNVTKLPSTTKSKRSTKSRAKKTTTARATATATKTARKATRTASRSAKRTVRKAADFTTKTIDTATKAATASNSTDALKNWTKMFQQTPSFLPQSPFKMEGFMNNASFPQFDQFQTQAQSAANQYTAILSKASAAAEKSRNRLAAGAEECGKTLASMAQSNAQRTNEAMRTLMTCKSLNEYADVQNRLFKQNFEAMSSEYAKLVEQVTKCVSSASEPLSDLASSAMADAKKTYAA